MRKTILTTIAAISLGATGVGANAAHAEQNNCAPGQAQKQVAQQQGEQRGQSAEHQNYHAKQNQQDKHQPKHV